MATVGVSAWKEALSDVHLRCWIDQLNLALMISKTRVWCVKEKVNIYMWPFYIQWSSSNNIHPSTQTVVVLQGTVLHCFEINRQLCPVFDVIHRHLSRLPHLLSLLLGVLQFPGDAAYCNSISDSTSSVVLSSSAPVLTPGCIVYLFSPTTVEIVPVSSCD